MSRREDLIEKLGDTMDPDNAARFVAEVIEEALAERRRAASEHNWQFYANGTFCTRCGTSIGSGSECRS